MLPDEHAYTRALSLSRLAYDLESLPSPTLAAALLTLVSFNWLFLGTVIGFFCSAALMVSVSIPQPPARQTRGFHDGTTLGMRIYLGTPRLRGLLALNLSVAAAVSMVFVNTVVLVKGMMGGSDGDVTLALACFGGGSMIAALLPLRLLGRFPGRRTMLASAAMLATVLIVFTLAFSSLPASEPLKFAVLATWMLLGVGYSAVLTPSGRLLRRSASAADRPAVFAAQFVLSHVCWLIIYPLAGWLGATAGLTTTLFVLASLTLAGAAFASTVWPAAGPDVVAHVHPELSTEHPHVRDDNGMHAHPVVIDDLHPRLS